MNVEHKLAFFSQVAAQEAEQKRAEILTDIEQKMSAAVAEFSAQSEHSVRRRLRQERDKIEKAKHKEITHAVLEAKRSVVELRAALTRELFAQVLEKIKAYTDTALYKKNLLDSILSLCARYPRANVYLMERDMDLAASIPTTCVCVQEDFIGGVKFLLLDKNAVEDHTYRTRMQAARENFAFSPPVPGKDVV
jgi:V/A-type H+-transporting ATPase subunit E